MQDDFDWTMVDLSPTLAVSASARKAKCRAVIQGFRDPHLHLVMRDSPVFSRLGFQLILLFAISRDWISTALTVRRLSCKEALHQNDQSLSSENYLLTQSFEKQ